jgi:hypothetical protein
VEVALLALQANGDELLVEPVELQETVLIEHLPHILYSVSVDQLMELLLFEHFQLDVHFAVLADLSDLLLLDPVDDVLEVEVLLGQVVPVNAEPLAVLEGILVTNDAVLVLEQLAFLVQLGRVHLLYLLLLLEGDLLPFEGALVVLVLRD